MKGLRLALAALLALGSTACFQSSTLLQIKADGSGTIVQRLVFTAAALEQMKQLAGASGANQDPGGFNPLSEDTAREMAAALGPGVSYVSSTPITTDAGEGREMVFAFDDIRTVRMSQQPATPDAAPSGAGALGFSLDRQANGNVVLRIAMPDAAGAGGASLGGSGLPTLPPGPQLAMLKPLLAGARVTIAIEPAGRLVRTSSPYVDGNRVTLVDLNLDALLADDTLLAKLQAAPDRAATQALLKDVPGVKIIDAPEITIEFTP